MVKREVIVKGSYFLVILLILVGLSFFYFNFSETEDPINVDALFLKVSLKKGDGAINRVNIENINAYPGDFSLRVKGLEDLVFLDTPFFNLEKNNVKKVYLNFSSTYGEVGAHLGKLQILLNGEVVREVPIIFEIQSKDTLYNVIVDLYPRGNEVVEGEKLSAEIKVYDFTGLTMPDISILNVIQDFEGNLLISETESKIITDLESYTKTFDISKAKKGDYVFITLVKNEGYSRVSSQFFEVIEKKNESEGIIKIILFSLILFFIVLSLFVYLFFYRNWALRTLRRSYKSELKFQEKKVRDIERENCRKLKGRKEKEFYRREVRKVRKKRRDYVRKEYHKRVKEYRSLKGRKKKDYVKRKINEWKKKGYDTSILDKTAKVPSSKDIEKKIRLWKKKGYDTSMLN